MIRGTTPTITMELPHKIPVSALDEAVFSMAQEGREVLQKWLADMERDTQKNTLLVRLSQEETYQLNAQLKVSMQLKIRIGEDVAVSDTVSRYTWEVLNKDVI